MRVLIRATTFLTGWVFFFFMVEAFSADQVGDANIGAGLLAFALVLLGAGMWGLVDGLRRPLQRP